MPIREKETFLAHFLADTEEEAVQLHKDYLKTLKMLARKYASVTGLDEEDLVSEGVIGLARAKRDFEQERGAAFRTFAIYKIKDALREFVSTQEMDINIPQYLRDASRLAMKLKKLLESAGIDDLNSYSTVWEKSGKCALNEVLMEELESVRQSLLNLSARSCTEIIQLLDRAEIVPLLSPDIVDESVVFDDGIVYGGFSSEEDLLNTLLAKSKINIIKGLLSDDEFNLLIDHYVEGYTVRELEDKLGIKAASIHVKIHSIINKLRRKLSRENNRRSQAFK